MKSWFTKLLALVLALCLCLTGCVTTQPGESSTTDPSSTAPTGPSESSGPDAPDGEYTLPREDGCNQLTIYWKGDEDLSKNDIWIWFPNKDGRGYVMHECNYGGKVVVNVPEDVTEVGFIVRLNCSAPGGTSWGEATKDATDSDRFVEMNGDTTIYLQKGDTNQYSSKDGGETLVIDKTFTVAAMTSFETIHYQVNPAVKLTSLDQVKVYQEGKQIEVLDVSSLNNTVILGDITLAEKLDLTKSYEVEIAGYGKKVVVPTRIFDSKEFVENYTYDGDDLGAVIKGDVTVFKVWAPTASKVTLNLFEAGNGGSAKEKVDMVKGERGVWEYTLKGNAHGTYYTYSVTTALGTKEATDPYAKAAGLNGDRSMVIDLDTTDPEGWDKDKVVELEKYTDATIWEIHVRDFSNKIASSEYKGKYLAFTERGLTNGAGISVGVDYLLNLGVTHIHLLPVYDYATVDEANPDSQFNWGYDPKNYNVPEGSYSTNPYDGEVRVKEFKQMVQSLHNDGLGVIMDVVYNHTYSADSNFNRIVPYYYYRFNSDGTNTSASGCGNDTASERYMFGKFMVDSVKYWAEEYNLDGFRFDLMGLHDLETMREIEKAVHAINPNAIIYGEGWTMGSTLNREPQANQTNISKIEPSEGAAGSIAVFNDAIRDGLKGSVFEEKGSGYISGDYHTYEGKVQFGIAGGAGSEAGWRVAGAAVINYMSAHDNHTLWDKLEASNGDNTVEERMAMNRLGAAIMMISQGTPFMQAGEEMLRTKDGDHNSYKSSDEINNLNWEALTADSNEYAMMLYYKGLLAMRSQYEIFRGNGDVKVSFGMLTGGGMTVEMKDDKGNEALVLINPTARAASYTLDGQWNLVATGTEAGAQVMRTDSDKVTVEAGSILVYVN